MVRFLEEFPEKRYCMKKVFVIAAFLVLNFSGNAVAQKKKTVVKDTPSVVFLRNAEKASVDSTAIKANPEKKRRKFGVKIVPAPPVGRSWQEIRYSDSLAKRP